MNRGFFGIGVVHGKNVINVGTLWRSGTIFGAAFLFTIGRRYRRQSSDTLKSWRHTPLYHYDTVDSLKSHLPFACRLVGIELCLSATPLADYEHHERCVYLLGAEDHGLPRASLDACHDVVAIPGERSLNVAVAGSIVMYDRITKAGVR